MTISIQRDMFYSNRIRAVNTSVLLIFDIYDPVSGVLNYQHVMVSLTVVPCCTTEHQTRYLDQPSLSLPPLTSPLFPDPCVHCYTYTFYDVKI